MTQSVRKLLVCGIVALLVAIAIVPSLQPVSFAQNETASRSQGVKTATELKTYTDPEGFFTLQYPSNWTTKYQPSVSKFDEPITLLYVDGKPSTYMSINVIPAPSTQQGLKDSFNQTVSYLRSKGDNVIRSQFGLYKIDGQDAGAVQLLTGQEKSIILSSVFNGKAIFIKFAASENDYNSHIAEVEKVIDSIKITGA